MTRVLLMITLLSLSTGCANRAGWGFPWGQGTVDRQNSRAVIHDPFLSTTLVLKLSAVVRVGT